MPESARFRNPGKYDHRTGIAAYYYVTGVDYGAWQFNLGRNCRWLEMGFSRICRRDNGANRLLIKSFEPAVALKIFQVAAQSPLFHKLIEL